MVSEALRRGSFHGSWCNRLPVLNSRVRSLRIPVTPAYTAVRLFLCFVNEEGSMPLRYAGTVLVSFCFLLSNMSGQEFSGRIISGERYIDLATYSPPTFGPWRIEKPPERLYVGDNKVRIEVQGSNGLHTWILDFSNNTFQVLERRHRVYSEGPLHMPIGSGARDAIYARPASRRRSSRPPEAEVERTSMLAAGLDELYQIGRAHV